MTLTRAERDSFASLTPKELAYGEGACLETPPRLFELLDQRFKFTIDLTANEQNHLLPSWFGPGSPLFRVSALPGIDAPEYATDALSVDWHKYAGTGAGFSNPPYGPFISRILKKAIEERDKGFTSVFLLPMRAAGWFRDLVLPYYSELWYCSERIVFHYQGKPRLSAGVKATNKHAPQDGWIWTDKHTLRTAIPREHSWTDTWGQAWTYHFKANRDIMEPAGALFDSIIVVYKPWSTMPLADRGQFGLFPPAQRPNIFEVKTGELRY